MPAGKLKSTESTASTTTPFIGSRCGLGLDFPSWETSLLVFEVSWAADHRVKHDVLRSDVLRPDVLRPVLEVVREPGRDCEVLGIRVKLTEASASGSRIREREREIFIVTVSKEMRRCLTTLWWTLLKPETIWFLTEGTSSVWFKRSFHSCLSSSLTFWDFNL